MQHEVLNFGSSGHLIGSYRRPERGALTVPVLVFWNTGLWGRSGPYRLNTEVALAAVAAGYATFTFDTSLRGDAGNRDDLSGTERSNADIQDALNLLAQRFGHQEFILFGVCSSAVEAHAIAVLDPRVTGLLMLDTYAYRIPNFYKHYYKQRVLSPKRWLNALRKTNEEEPPPEGDTPLSQDLFEGVYPEVESAGRDLQSLVDRGMKIWVGFTGGFRHIYSYKNQFKDTFSTVDFRTQLELRHYPNADHLFAVRSERQAFIADVLAWIKLQFPHAATPLHSSTPQDLAALIHAWEKTTDGQAPAIIMGQESLSYTELGARVDSIVLALKAAGVKAQDRVGIALPRSPDLIASIVATVKIGACYVPIDLSYPEARVRSILEVAGPILVIADARNKPRSLDYRTLDISTIKGSTAPGRLPVAAVGPHDPVYIIFTSGSTGTPKGVTMGHAALAQLIHWQNTTYRPHQRTLQFSPISFDVSFQEIFSTLAAGQCLVLISEEQRLDPRAMLEVLRRQQVDRLFLPYVALQLLAEAGQRQGVADLRLRDVFTAGEQLIATAEIRAMFQALPEARLHNHYGPSETHVATALSLDADPSLWPDLPGIGTAISGSVCLIVDEQGQVVDNDQQGELYLCGSCVGEGYWGQEAMTRQRFVTIDHSGQTFRAYRSGDLAQWQKDGSLKFLGRMDDQVKVRGYRIELGEIEAALQKLPGIEQAVALVTGGSEKQLIAAIKCHSPTLDPQKTLGDLAQALPAYMLPQQLIPVDEILRTPSGKIDRRGLALSLARQAAPTTAAEKAPAPKQLTAASDAATTKDELHRLVHAAYCKVLGRNDVGPSAHFFELGGTSILAVKLAYLLEDQLARPVSAVAIFEHPRLVDLAMSLSDKGAAPVLLPTKPQEDQRLRREVAIVGMAARFPGANNLAEFWDLLSEGREGITHFSDTDLDPSIPLSETRHPQYVKARGIIAEADCFDADFFKVAKTEAQLLDPQQRVFLECCYHALEDAGLLGDHERQIGVFAGAAHSTYYINRVLKDGSLLGRAGSFAAMLANDKDYLATRVAFKLDLHGPAIDVQTACSSSAVAIVQAMQAIRSGMCDVALAGGVAIHAPIRSGYIANEGAMLSPSGQCRPFAAAADGTIFSDGAGVIVLKDLQQAKNDGDRIYAVICGSGINNDGAGKASFTAPSVTGQRGAVLAAYQDAGIDPAEVSFLECHGTATALGDPIEIEALSGVFPASKSPDKIAIGSVKGNIGHTTAAAGVAGVIKAALCLYHRRLTPSLHAAEVNPLLKLEQRPFAVAKETIDLNANRAEPLAGVSSFGVGGTNVHLVLKAAGRPVDSLSAKASDQLLLFSSHHPQALSAYGEAIKAWSSRLLAEEQSALALNLQRRKTMPLRGYHLRHTDGSFSSFAGQGDEAGPPVILGLFPGQGSGATGMGRQLGEQHPLFRQHLQRLLNQAEQFTSLAYQSILWDDDKASLLSETAQAQVAIYCVSLAAAYTLRDQGLDLGMLLGHSIGEIAAATYAGVFQEQDGIALICRRAALMQALPKGGMLAVALSQAAMLPLLDQDLDLAAVNGAQSVVVAGPEAALSRQQEVLGRQGISCKRLTTSHAFHTRAMTPMLEAFGRFVETLPTEASKRPIYSSYLGRLASSDELRTPQHWVQHARTTVNFFSAASALTSLDQAIFAIELGSGAVLTKLLRPILAARPLQVLPMLDAPSKEWSTYLKLVGGLYAGHAIKDAKAFLPAVKLRSIWCPPYAFVRQRFYSEAARSSQQSDSINPVSERSASMSQSQARIGLICAEVVKVLEECSGQENLSANIKENFFDLGLDSLFLTQASLSLGSAFGTSLSFRQLSEELCSIEAVANYLAEKLPKDKFVPAATTPIDDSKPATTVPAMLPAASPAAPVAPVAAAVMPATMPTHQATINFAGAPLAAIVQQQMELMHAQLQLLQGQPLTLARGSMPVAPPAPLQTPIASTTNSQVSTGVPSSQATEEAAPPKQAFGAIARISQDKLAITPEQRRTLDDFIKRYNDKTKSSKSYAARYRGPMADPRVVSGFRPNFKELIYPLVTVKSEGPYIWDVDGRRYTDMLNGFGSNFFGYNAPFIVAALNQQISKGFEIGPQAELVGPLSELAAKMTGHERVAWCNTGSEAVLGCLRIARTITGKKKVVSFLGSYHGINDEVIVRSNAKLRPFPAAPGIMPNAVENMLVLEYGTEESLAIIEKELGNLAAVLVEPVQSRRPEFVPVEFWRRLRAMTEKAGVALIFDEVITGFRYHPGGVQMAFGIQADLASYGKVVGGGLPIGMVAGRRAWMDALDGGSWQFGDHSIPEVGVTYFAGTFVRHPLSIAAAHASLSEMQKHQGRLQAETNALSDRLCSELNQLFSSWGVPYYYCNFGSLMKLKTKEDQNPFNELLACWLRDKGIHVWDLFPNFMTTSHDDTHRQQIVQAFDEAIAEMVAGGLFPNANHSRQTKIAPAIPIKVELPLNSKQPPVPGARLGKDAQGRPTWFVEDATRPGRYIPYIPRA